MFEVQPVRSKELQSQIAALLGCEFRSDTYAFFAGELVGNLGTDDGGKAGACVCLCRCCGLRCGGKVKSHGDAPMLPMWAG